MADNASVGDYDTASWRIYAKRRPSQRELLDLLCVFVRAKTANSLSSADLSERLARSKTAINRCQWLIVAGQSIPLASFGKAVDTG